MSGLQEFIARNRKIIAFVVGAALTLAIEKWGTANEWVSLGILLATGLGVYQVPNTPAPAEPTPVPAPPAAVPDPPAEPG
jgi:hypothetical protein